MQTRAPTTRTSRTSCRLGCVVAALLVTLGGLRLLVAAEPVSIVTPPAAEAAATVTPVRTARPVDDATWRPTSRDFETAVVRQAEQVECVPGACGFPRVRALDDGTSGWTALERRVLTAVLPSFREAGERPSSAPASWFPVEACSGDCPGRLDVPDALVARF